MIVRWLPLSNVKYLNFFGIIFTHKNTKIISEDLNHELIHTEQMKELLYIFFYIWYIIEFIIRFLFMWNWKAAYRNLLFEQEAYYNEKDLNYLTKRKHYKWLCI